ncbi:MAG TPA: peptidylprolyl isomerase [Caulobacteraceae bacterium]|jgi:peptidyl-prolyl cis-trans isomerase A (cyclophilin A)|nr:peptidylprolyl isomerase [Caulobacteraceae bacterium]
MSAIAATRRHLLAAAAILAAGPAWAQAVARTRVRLETEKGVILIELADDKAPITVANFLHYVDSKHMDGAQFYRAARAPGAPTIGLIEAGVRDARKVFAPIAHESTLTTGLRHLDGTLSMGRFAPGTATSDFSICCGDAPYLDAHPEAPGDNLGYAAFGQVVDGMDVARVILALPTAGDAQNPDMQGQMLAPPVNILTARRV